MEAQVPRSSYVTGSHNATLRAKHLGNIGRITVARYESNVHGKDPNKVTVSWDHSLNVSDNYERAILEYVRRANLGGHWITSTITDGAVGVRAGDFVA